jgi:hypothetical protein
MWSGLWNCILLYMDTSMLEDLAACIFCTEDGDNRSSETTWNCNREDYNLNFYHHENRIKELHGDHVTSDEDSNSDFCVDNSTNSVKCNHSPIYQKLLK